MNATGAVTLTVAYAQRWMQLEIFLDARATGLGVTVRQANRHPRRRWVD
jgi:hypothetical protein